MARKLRAEGEDAEKQESGVKPMDNSTFRSLTAALVSKKADLQEQTGEFGKKTQSVAEATGMTPQVISTIVKFKRMEPAKRTAHIAMLMTALEREGFTAEPTLFGTPKEQAASERAPATTGDGTASNLKTAKSFGGPKSEAEIAADIGKENGKAVARGIKPLTPEEKAFDDQASGKPSRRGRSFGEPPAPPADNAAA